MSSNPVPYNYPPYEVLYLNDVNVFDPALTGTTSCAPGMKTWRTLFPKYRWATQGLRAIDDWCPDNFVTAAYANFVGPPPPGYSPLPPPMSHTFVLARVPKAILTKIMITLRVTSPLVPGGDFNPRTQFWTTEALDTTKPWIIGYTEGSSDSTSYKRAVSTGDSPTDVWLEFARAPSSSTPREGTRNMILCWNGLDDFVAQCDKVENFTTMSANDTWKYTIDTLRNGVHMTPGDRLCFLQPHALLSKIATFYITLEFAQDPQQPHAPYHDSGYRAL